MLFKPGAVDALSNFLDEHRRAGIVKPKLLSDDGAVRASARRWYTIGTLLAVRGPWRQMTEQWTTVQKSRYADWDYHEPRLVDWLPFAGVMVRREAFQSVSGVDERFPFYFEDVDFSFRLHEAGWEVWCHPGAEMIHLENRASLEVFSRPGGRHLLSLLKFWWKHKGLRPPRL
jgi:GT2 family glycosyltransferase